MKKCFVLTALIAAIAVGQSESQRVDISPKMDVPSPVVQGSRESSPEDAKRTWVDKVRGVRHSRRDKAVHRRMKVDGLSASEIVPPHVTHIQTPTPRPESEYLKEIASVLHKSPKQIDNLLARAKKLLRAELQQGGMEP